MEELYFATIGAAQSWLFEHVVQPALYALGLINFDEVAFPATEWFILGVLELAVLWLVLGWLERRIPAEPRTDNAAVRTDILYTLLHRLGVVPLVFFFSLRPLADAAESMIRQAGYQPLNLEDLAPALSASPFLAFLVYLVVLDFAEYWRHRFQHRFDWWWALHAVHHSQRQMTFWSDNRNHLFDDAIQALWLSAIAIVIGVPPGQFFLIVILTRMLESLSHANLRLSFGTIGERLLVSPRFHRRHHAIGFGHEGVYRGCNFAVLFPVWDVLFRTADYSGNYAPTGIRDQLDGRDYGRGFLAQQWIGAVNMVRALIPRRERPTGTPERV
jgi:sterol desaturase/sphingolipid hydroxylase (fatty acid hydroxylase superfamily)